MSRAFNMLARLLCIAVLAAGVARAETESATGMGPSVPLAEMPRVTRVVVHKAARRMDLMNGDRVLRSYRISLGLQPQGHKEREGDFRTPEGRYMLTRRNPLVVLLCLELIPESEKN